MCNKVIASEAVLVAGFAAFGDRPRSPMMTVSGTAAEGPPAPDDTRRIAAEGVSPQHVAVMGPDTEKRLAVIPVILYVFRFFICCCKGTNFFRPARIFIEVFLSSKR